MRAAVTPLALTPSLSRREREKEDAHYFATRDVLSPIRDYADAAFNVQLPFYGVNKSAERKRMIASGGMHRLVKVLQEHDWPKLAERMQAFDARHVAEK